MANTVIGASVQVDFQSVGEMRNALKKANDELLLIQQKFGQFSSQAQEAAQKVIGIKDQIENANNSTNILTSKDKFKNFTTSLSAVANGFSAVQSGMALLGNSGEDLQKQLLKVQAAMAFATSISELRNLKEAFTLLGQNAVAVFRSIKIAIGSTGIGLLVVALGAIVAYWDDIKSAVSGVSEEQKKLNKESEANLKAQRGKLDAISKQENTLKLQGKSEKEILKSKIDQTNQTIKAAEINLKNSIQTQKAQVAAAKRNKEILEGLIAFVSLPITTVLKGIDLIGQAVGKNFDLYGKFTGGLASLVFDPDQVKADGDASIKAQEDALVDLKNQRDGFELSLRNDNKKSNDARSSDNKKSNDDLIRIEKEAQEDLLKSRMTLQERELFELKKGYDEKKKVLEQGGKSTAALTELYEKQKAEVELKYQKQREEQEKKYQDIVDELVKRKQGDRNISDQERARQAVIDKYAKEREELLKQYPNNLQLSVLLKQNEELELAKIDKSFEDKRREQRNENNRLRIETEKAFAAELLAVETELQNQKYNVVNGGLDLLQQLAGKNEKIANVFFAIQKAIEIGRIITSTASSIALIKAQTAAIPAILPPGVPNPAYFTAVVLNAKRIASLKLGAALNIAQIAAASISKFKSGGQTPSGGGQNEPPPPGNLNAPLQPGLSPAVQGQALNANAINNLGNQSLRAYVMNSDIQNNNQRNAYLERNARIG
jgi:hypothetical protein